jgi:hypothetical protein
MPAGWASLYWDIERRGSRFDRPERIIGQPP